MIDTSHAQSHHNTLQRELPSEWQVLLWCGQLQAVRFKDMSALQLLSNAVCCLRNASTRNTGLLDRFCTTNEGIHSLSLGVLYLHGVLPTGRAGHRAMAMQIACEAMHLPVMHVNQIIYANTHRELISYGSTEPVAAAELEELLQLSALMQTQARYWYPDWFD